MFFMDFLKVEDCKIRKIPPTIIINKVAKRRKLVLNLVDRDFNLQQLFLRLSVIFLIHLVFIICKFS